MADVRLPTLNCRDPMAVGPRWIVPDVLLVAALQISNPIQFFIQMKPNNFPRLTFKLSLPLHDELPGSNRPRPSFGGQSLRIRFPRARQLRRSG
jgi:hypothetical protein